MIFYVGTKGKDVTFFNAIRLVCILLKSKGSSSLPVSQTAPKWRRQKLHKRPGSDEEPTLPRIHAHLLEVHSHQRKQRPESRVEEEIESLDSQQLLVHVPEEKLQDVRLASDLVCGFLGLSVHLRIDLSEGLGIHLGADPGLMALIQTSGNSSVVVHGPSTERTAALVDRRPST